MGDVSTYVSVNMICHNGINSTKITLVVILNIPSLLPTTFTMIISARSLVVLGTNDAVLLYSFSLLLVLGGDKSVHGFECISIYLFAA